MNWFSDFGHVPLDTMKDLFELVKYQYQGKTLNLQSEMKIFSEKETDERTINILTLDLKWEKIVRLRVWSPIPQELAALIA